MQIMRAHNVLQCSGFEEYSMINDIISDDDMIILNVWTTSIYMHTYVYTYMCKYRNKHEEVQ